MQDLCSTEVFLTDPNQGEHYAVKLLSSCTNLNLTVCFFNFHNAFTLLILVTTAKVPDPPTVGMAGRGGAAPLSS